MRFFFMILVVTTMNHSSSAQVHLTTPLEILTFMEASPTKYEFEQLYGDIPIKNRTIIPHGTYIKQIDGKEHQLHYEDSESTEETEWKTKARDLISVENPKYEKARKLYHKILKKSPQNAQIYTLIGETYYEEGAYEQALPWFEQAIELNSIDYLARWLKAEILLKQHNIDTAITALTLAHIYNRNHPRLLKRLVEVYHEFKIDYFQDWGFAPQMYIYKDGETVVVTADGIWLTYGMYKAVWNYDPDYNYIKEQQEVTDYLFQQEMEAMIGTFMTYNSLRKDDKRNYPSMNAFGLALDEEMVEEFVMYEILLVNQPTLANHTTEEFLKRLMEYIVLIRGQKFTE